MFSVSEFDEPYGYEKSFLEKKEAFLCVYSNDKPYGHSTRLPTS